MTETRWTTATGSDVVARFCPSPTGNPHVGMARTALFSWAFARHNGGRFVFRIEDTDASRDSQESYDLLLDVMRWLGLDWDEGVEVGGPNGPYRQSQRMDVYADVAQRLMDAGFAYKAYDTAEELEERRNAARAAGRPSGYDGLHRDLTPEQQAAFEAEGRQPVIRFKMPQRDWTFDDLVRGEITFGAENVQDFVIVRANGQPLYTLTNPVDDALMGITHVLRGEDILSSTPRQMALYEAFAEIGVGSGFTPRFGHLPYVMGSGNKKLSKRDPESNLLGYRDQGFLPEGLLNYLALLGWSIAEDRDIFSLDEMVAAFEIERVNPNPARFDLKKCEAINGDHVRMLSPEVFVQRLLPYLPQGVDVDLVTAAAPLVQERSNLLTEAADMLAFLFAGDDFTVDPDDAAKQLNEDGLEVAKAAREALAGVGEWTTESIEAALRQALIEERGLKPRLAFGPVRVAVTGKRISPPLFESMELLGREASLARLDAVL
ncbi:glutamate--tRNA ligase [Aeromicrobium sp. 636]|uniref:Glutamate--tRNA ligase n=1 Tax=Aeromicrobium senzhongii TaxID=2663859 RepID=A0A8I0EU26_9ACTN|nr:MULTISPECIES: glutamate--tRNA ligase [Aeromicrobium]MBC9225618.1 glutamate--tRNA ligase [Aeromicrobium senzhongii]MCQ3997727.1 glutamate--tRNA ligase [Aeromicrobium sp. 636]MTB87654.1 glutamate--tRNA ligase [Aeromicrobium senzhongii]QNL95312.1 glutamate--tRNA ligase [Aeromicrobium senzhongii]